MQSRGGMDLDTLNDLCASAAERVSDRLRAFDTDSLPRGLNQGTLEVLAELLPMLVQGYFLEQVGETGIQDRLRAAVRRFGGDGARSVSDIDAFIRVTSSGRTFVIESLLDELGDAVGPEVKLGLFRGIMRSSDDLFSEYLVGYTEELVALRHEPDPASSTVAGSLQTGLAMGDLEGRILYANPTFARLLGLGVGTDLIGRTWSEVVVDNGIREVLETARRRGEAWEQFESHVDEQSRILRLGMRVVDDRLHVVLFDTSDQAQAEHERREFIRGLMHDIRSPLTLMSGWANTLLRSESDLDGDTRRRALETIMRAAKQVGSLTENLLELDLVEGGYELETRPFDVATRIREIVDHSGIEDIRVTCGASTIASGDPEAFERVLTNLLDNAAAHGRPPIHIDLAPTDVHLCVTVQDAGRTETERIVEAFAGRVNSSNGFGLGLHATSQLIEAMGGTIELSDADPTTFLLMLRLA